LSYDLWYWSGIQGRGEFVRLPMEAAGIAYRDCARERGDDALVADLKARRPKGPFAPPYLVMDGICIAQVAHILTWLADRHDLAPSGDDARTLWLIQLQLTITDVVAEVHNVHHPVDAGDYYEGQKPEAARAAFQFREVRLPKFLRYFDDAVGASGGEWAGGARWSPADTSLFQLVEGLTYMFPRRMAAIAGDYPHLHRLRDQVAALPGVADYLRSDRRIGFNQQGIFRHYPELDAA